MRVPRFLFAMFFLLPLATATTATLTPARSAELTLACLDVGRSVAACRSAAAKFAEETGHTVRVVSASGSGRTALEQYKSLFSIESPRLDVIQFPEGWAPALARDLVSLNAPLNEFLTAAADTAVVRGQTLGLPHHLAVTVLFVRNDVIEESVSVWTELRDRLLQAPTDGATGLSIGAAGPATFPFFLDWYYSTGGIDLTDRQAVRDALSLLAELIGAVAISGAPTARAADAVNQFARGSTAALVTRSTQRPAVSKSEIAERIAVRTRPHLNQGGRSPALVSTWLLGVSRFSRNKEPAKALATYLTSEEVQRSAAIEFGLAPTRETVLTDEDVKAAGPILAELHELGPSLRAPPVDLYGLHYLDLADAVAGEVRGLFAGDLTVDAAANAIVRDARRAERLGEGE